MAGSFGMVVESRLFLTSLLTLSVLLSSDEPAVISSGVQQKEDAVVSASLQNRLQALSLRGQQFPCRPEFVSGAPVKLRTNYFEVQTNPKAEIFRYIVAVTDLQDNQKRKKGRIIELLLEDPVLKAARPAIATDFAGLIVTAQRLKLERTPDGKDRQSFDVLYKVCHNFTFCYDRYRLFRVGTP